MKKAKATPSTLRTLTVKLVAQGAALTALNDAFLKSSVDEHKVAYLKAMKKLQPGNLKLAREIRSHSLTLNGMDELELRLTTLLRQRAVDHLDADEKAAR